MLFFFHIPKTGGTSLYNALRRMAPDRLAWYNGPDTAPPKFLSAPEARRTISIYAGHFGYGQIRTFLAPGDKMYSVIRDPVERVFSHYNHVAVRDRKHPLHEQIKDLPIIEAAKACPIFRSEITNILCFYLSGTRKFEDAKHVVFTEKIQVYDISQLNLLMSHIAIACGVGSPPKVGADNVSENDYGARVTMEERDFVMGLNEEDIKLFLHLKAELEM
jgi:Sulfotransferase family